MLIRANGTLGEAFGLVENGEMIGYPGVALVLIFVDQDRARPGVAMEAFAMYVGQVFSSGARLVDVEVVSFNQPVLCMLRRNGVTELARLRDQMYTGGRFWDVLVCAFDAEQFSEITSRYPRLLPGGGRKAAALGSRRRA
jgi:RimJ/RimL family protein N-acetyltransferase